MERWNGLGSLKSFPWYVPQLSGASILCFHSLGFPRVSVRSGCSLMAARWQVFFVPSWVPSGLTSSPCSTCRWLWYLLFCQLNYSQEAAFQRALQYHPKEERGNIRVHVIKVKGEVHASVPTFYRGLLLVLWRLLLVTRNRCYQLVLF